MARDELKRPGWFPDWLPVRCGNGHPLLPGRVSISRVGAPDCPVTTDDRGHDLWVCATDGCGWRMAPPGCTGPHAQR